MNKDIIITEDDRVPDGFNIGQKYHVIWAAKGCVFVLKSFLPNWMVEIETPKTKKVHRTSISSLRLINKDAKQKAIKRLKDAQTKLKLQ